MVVLVASKTGILKSVASLIGTSLPCVPPPPAVPGVNAVLARVSEAHVVETFVERAQCRLAVVSDRTSRLSLVPVHVALWSITDGTRAAVNASKAVVANNSFLIVHFAFCR